MSNERPRSRITALFVDHFPTVAGGAMLLWLVVEFAVRRGLARALSDPLGTTVGAGAVSVTVGFTLAAVGIAWWGTQAGIEPPEWEYTLSRCTIAAGIAGTIGLYVLSGVAVVVLTAGFGLGLPTDARVGLTGTPV